MEEDPANVQIDKNTSNPKADWFGSRIDGFAETESEYGDTDELDSLDSDEEYGGTSKSAGKRVEFDKHTDLKDPQFKVEQYFPDLATIRKAVRNYSIVNSREVIWEKNENTRVRVRCQPGCD